MGQEEEATVAKAEEERKEKSEENREEKEEESWNYRKQSLVVEISKKLIHGDLNAKIEAAREIRKLVRKSFSSSSASPSPSSSSPSPSPSSSSPSPSPSSSSSVKTRSRLGASGVIQPLVLMLVSPNPEAREASLLALLNLAVRDERNKIKIVTAGAVPPLVDLLRFQSGNLRELATAAILTLSAAGPNKPIIASSGAAPLLVQILSSGSVQGRVDAVTALHNLSTSKDKDNPSPAAIGAGAAPPLVDLLRNCKKKSSKFAEKATALLEILSRSEEGQAAITASAGGILTLVETVEDGSLVSTEHAVGALLSLCRSSRDKYRELILGEGAIPGLLRLTAEGTAEARDRARELLDLLRETPEEKKLSSSALEKIVYDIAARVDGADKAAETAKRLLEDMVQRSMEHSLNRIRHRAATSCANSDISTS